LTDRGEDRHQRLGKKVGRRYFKTEEIVLAELAVGKMEVRLQLRNTGSSIGPPLAPDKKRESYQERKYHPAPHRDLK